MENGYKIKYKGKEFDASEYQAKIMDEIKALRSNISILAVAGASKTSTIVSSINYINTKKKILFLAFNKSIVDEIKKSFEDNDNVSVMTFHQLGLEFLRKNEEYSKLFNSSNKDIIKEYKYINYINNIKANINYLKGNKKKEYINNIKSILHFARQSNKYNSKDLEKLAKFYDIDIIDDEIKVVQSIMDWGSNNTDEIDFTDLIWLPNVKHMDTKLIQYDIIFVDEAQDVSESEYYLAKRALKARGHFVAVGDKAQQINVWAGASEKAFDMFNDDKSKEFKLPITYRCSRKVVEYVNDNTIGTLKASDNAPEGAVNFDVSEYAPKNGDMVLCRNTAPLIALKLRYLERNISSYIKGETDIKNTLINAVNSTNAKLIDANMRFKDGMFTCLYTQLLDKIEYHKKAHGLTNDDEAFVSQNIYEFFDTIMCLKVLSKGLLRTDELISKINIIFNESSGEYIQLSTIHKAKGLESDNVYILKPSAIPSKYAEKKWEKDAEENLRYVAYTRARLTLNFIKEDKNDFFKDRDGTGDIKSTVEFMRRKLNYAIANSEDFVEKCDTLKQELMKPKVLGETDNNTTIKKTKKGGLKFKSLMDDE